MIGSTEASRPWVITAAVTAALPACTVALAAGSEWPVLAAMALPFVRD